MKLSAKQTTAYKSALSGTKNVILYGGAIRGGKTYWLLLTFISLCSKYPKSRWVIVRESLPTLKRTTLVSFQRIIEDGLLHHIKDFNRDTYTVTFNNESQLIFMAESFNEDKELNRFRGLEVNGAGIDEINECQQATFYKLVERAGSWNGNEGNAPLIVLATCNPTHNWVKEEFYQRYIDGTLPEQWQYIPAKITDNPYIPDRYLQSLKDNMPPDEYKRFVEGDWDVVKVINPFATQFNQQHHVCPVQEHQSRQLFISVDFNLNPFCAVFSHLWNDGRWHWHIIDEVAIDNGSLPDMIDVIKRKYEHALPNCRITGDAMGRRGEIGQRDNASLYMQLRAGLGIRESQIITPPNPTHENSRADVNYILFHSTKTDGWIDFKIYDTCKGSISDMQTVQCDALGSIIKGNRKDTSQQADRLDCVRYMANTFLKDHIIRHQKIKGYKTEKFNNFAETKKIIDGTIRILQAGAGVVH